MSQKKMDAYKYAKKNKKQLEKKRKRNKILAWIFGILAAALVITGCVILVLHTQNSADSGSSAITSSGDSTSDAQAQDIAELLQDSLGDGDYSIEVE